LKYVIYASVALKWFVQEDFHLNALALTKDDVQRVAPDILLAEVANALRRQVRMRLVSDYQASEAIPTMLGSFGDLIPSRDLIESAFNLSSQLDHSVYDCIYLAATLAEDDRILVTADRKFAAKALAAGFGKKIQILEAIPTEGGFNLGLENENG
jgi:predicted nucleic acid-binding protein